MEDNRQKLCSLLASITDRSDMEALLDDLCTPKEVDNMAERLAAAGLLLEGRTYHQVMENCRISSATLSRVSRCVRRGKGYARVLGASLRPH